MFCKISQILQKTSVIESIFRKAVKQALSSEYAYLNVNINTGTKFDYK